MSKLEDEYEKQLEEDLIQEAKTVKKLETIGSIIAGIIIFFGMIMTIIFLFSVGIVIYFVILGVITLLGGVFLYFIVKVYCVMAYNLIRLTDIADRIEHKK